MTRLLTEKAFVNQLHTSTSRDYLARVNAMDKAVAAELATQWERDYWDGDRLTGYGGYKYDGRWRPVAQSLVQHYDLQPGMKVLDVGCGKGFLLFDLMETCPGLEVRGIDISTYALEHAKEEVKDYCIQASAERLPFPDHNFDLVISINTLHNLYNYQLRSALRDISRVSRGLSYICVESYRNEREKVNLMYWQLTCRSFHTPAEWLFEFAESSYTGDYEFIYFE